MTQHDIVLQYLPLVDFIAEVAGAHSEVVLHDVTSPDNSLVAIRNGSMSGRRPGAKMSEFARKILSEGKRSGKRYISNYLSGSYRGGRFLKSSTFFIKDDSGEIIGMLGINTDLSAVSEAHRVLGQMLDVIGVEDDAPGEDSVSIKETVLSVIDQVIGSRGADPSRMTPEEKKELVDALNDRGVFLLKGVVSEVADRLEVSEQTIYRYLK